MIGQRVAGQLPAGDAVAVVVHRQEQRVYAGLFLENVEHLLDTLVHKRDSADLYGDHFLASGRLLRSARLRRGYGQSGHCRTQKLSSLHILLLGIRLFLTGRH